MRLETAEALPPPPDAAPDKPASWVVVRLYQDGVLAELPTDEIATDEVAYAEANHSRWVVRCPFCPSAQLASITDRRFWCVDCRMVDNEGRWVAVEWPDDVEEIEELLTLRPARNRNWRVGESVARLRRENHRELPEPTPPSQRPTPPAVPPVVEPDRGKRS